MSDAAPILRAIHWFEIPVHDLDRAQRCYEAVLGRTLQRQTLGPMTMAMFPSDPAAGTGGCLVVSTTRTPSRDGTCVFLNAEPSLDAAVGRAERAGLAIETPRVELPDGMGAYAIIIDSEGNRFGLHALR
jgi:uncharacterized protein